MTMSKIELRFLLLGKTGEGKSATGNSLLMSEVFHTSSNATSVTKKVSFGKKSFGQYDICVVDGPGMKDTDDDDDDDDGAEAALNFKEALVLCRGGVHAFLIVFKYGNRLTKEVKDMLETWKKVFGEGYMDRVIVIMTNGDTFEKERTQSGGHLKFENWCQQQKGTFKMVYEKCKGRFLLFNNFGTDVKQKTEQIEKVITLTKSMQTSTSLYSSKCFEDALAERLRADLLWMIKGIADNIDMFDKRPENIQEGNVQKEIDQLLDKVDQLEKTQSCEDIIDLKKKVQDMKSWFDKIKSYKKRCHKLEQLRITRGQWTKVGSICAAGTALIALPLGALAAGGTAMAFSMITAKEQELQKKNMFIRNEIIKIREQFIPTPQKAPNFPLAMESRENNQYSRSPPSFIRQTELENTYIRPYRPERNINQSINQFKM